MMRHGQQVGFLLLGALLGWWGRGFMDKKGVNNMHTDEMIDPQWEERACALLGRCEELKTELNSKQVRTHLHKYFVPARPTLP
jgi:hypothetical protein